MWRMIMQYLPSEQAASQATQFATGPWVRQHGEHANWKNLIDEYQTYIDNYDPWTLAQCQEHWLKKIGGAQRQLPIHVLQEYCHPDRPFHPCPTFKEDKFPRKLDVDISKISIDFSLYRASAVRLRGLLRFMTGRVRAIAPIDRTAISTLLETRISQRRELVASLTSGVLAKPAPR